MKTTLKVIIIVLKKKKKKIIFLRNVRQQMVVKQAISIFTISMQPQVMDGTPK